MRAATGLLRGRRLLCLKVLIAAESMSWNVIKKDISTLTLRLPGLEVYLV